MDGVGSVMSRSRPGGDIRSHERIDRHRRERANNLEIVDDTAAEKREQSAARAQLEARKQALAASVRACGHGDARVVDLIAELLWFHQRSQKPGWWALFERQAWSEDELVDDAESLGGLQLDIRTPPVQVKKSLDTTYVFPPQDTKLKVGDTPHSGMRAASSRFPLRTAGSCCAVA